MEGKNYLWMRREFIKLRLFSFQYSRVIEAAQCCEVLRAYRGILQKKKKYFRQF
jgi:hypothetical protein